MKTQTRRTFATRSALIKLLSDEEATRVALAEARAPIEGEDYVDLSHPELGVLKVKMDGRIAWSNVLPRSAVHDKTWSEIVARVATL